MAVKDYMEAQGAVIEARKLRQGSSTIATLLPAHVAQAMAREAERLEGEVREWCEHQECPQEAEALAYRRFWELDTLGKLVRRSAVAA